MAGISFEDAVAPTKSSDNAPSKGISFEEAVVPKVDVRGFGDKEPIAKQETKPTDSTVGRLTKSFIGGTASALDFPLSAPGFVAATGAELLTTTGGMLAKPFTGETSKEIYQRGAKVGQVAGEYLMNPMQRLTGMFQEADYYSNAPLPQLMGWFSDKLQKGGEKLEAATGIPSEAVPLATNVGMLAAGAKGVKTGQELLKEKQQPFKVTEPLKKQEVSKTDITPPPLGATPEQINTFKAKVKKEAEQRTSASPLVEAAIRNKETGEIERMGPKHDEDRKINTTSTPAPSEDVAVRLYRGEGGGQIGESVAGGEWFTTDINKAKRYGNVSYVDLSQKDLLGTAQGHGGSDTFVLSETLRNKAKPFLEEDTHDQGFLDERGNFLDRQEAVDRAVNTGQVTVEGKKPVLEIPKDGLHSGDLRKAGDERFAITESQPTTIPKSLSQKVISAADGFVMPVEQVAKEGDGAMSPWLMSDGKIIGTGQDHLGFAGNIIDGPMPNGYSDFMNETGAIRASMFVDKTTGDFVVTLHMAEGQKPTKAQLDVLNQIEKERGKPITILAANKDGLVNPEYKPTTIKQLKEQITNKVKTSSSSDELPIDRTKTSPRDVRDDKEFLSIATDIYEKHGEVEAVEFFKGYQEYKKTWGNAIGEVEKFIGTNLNSKEANERIVHNNTRDLKELAGKDVNLEQLSFDIDKGVPLEGKAKEVATKFRTLMDDLGQQALESGVIKGWHENYVARNVISEGNAPKGALEEFMHDVFGYGDKASGSGTKTTTKYGQERRLKTREDLTNHINGINTWLEQNGKDYRFKLKTDNLADIYKDYALSVQKAIENKNLIDNIKQIRNINGESLIRLITDENPRPYGYKSIEHADLDNYAIHPDLIPHLRFVFDSPPGKLMQALGSISQFIKRINVIGSFFHAKSLMEVQSSANIPIWSPLKESLVLPAVELAIKKTTDKDLQFSAISKAVEQFKKGGLGSSVDRWIREDGLQLGVPEDVTRGILSATGKFADTLIGKYGPKTRALEKSLSTTEKYTLGYFDKYTWDYLHTGIKLSTAEAFLDKARMQAAKESKLFDESASRKEIAKFLNEAGGGLNWYQAALDSRTEFGKRVALAAFSPAGRRALQIVLFAPDWTVSTVRAFSSALPKNLNPTKWQPVEGIKGLVTPTTKADYARLYQFKTALVYFTLINALNNMIAGRNIWDNKDPTRIEWPDGTSMQAMKHAMEPYHWIADPDKTLSNKLGFIPKALVIGFGGVEYASPTAPKLVDLSLAGRAKAVLGTTLPFQAQAGVSAPEGEGVQRALLGTMGFPVYGKTAEQNKQARAERELALKENAWKYRNKEIEAGRMPNTPKHERERLSLERQRRKLNKEAK